jgi:anti-anti-sigma factor
MKILVSEEEVRVPVTVFHIEGEIVAESYEQLQQQAEAAFEAGTRNLLLDLGDVAYVSSSGLRTIHHIFMLFSPTGAEGSSEAVRQGVLAGTYQSPHLKLLNPSPDVRQLLKAAGFDMFLEIYSDRQKALASF